jgi:hypothetical protein
MLAAVITLLIDRELPKLINESSQRQGTKSGPVRSRVRIRAPRYLDTCVLAVVSSVSGDVEVPIRFRFRQAAPHVRSVHGRTASAAAKAEGVLGHANIKTTQIYMHYARDEQDVALVSSAFASPQSEPRQGPERTTGRASRTKE